MAEREGFEPSVPRKGYNGFRDRPDRPLRHLSAGSSSTVGAWRVIGGAIGRRNTPGHGGWKPSARPYAKGSNYPVRDAWWSDFLFQPPILHPNRKFTSYMAHFDEN